MDTPPANLDSLEATEAVYLRRPPFWSIGITLLTALAGALLLDALSEVVPQLWKDLDLTEALDQLGRVGVWVLIAGALLARRIYVRQKPLQPIRFHDDYVELPANVNAARSRRVPYPEILSIYLGGYPSRLRVLLESRRHIFHFDQLNFLDPAGPQLVFFELRKRILKLPNGQAMLEAMRKRQDIAGRAMSTRPWATHALLGILTAIYLNQVLAGALDPMDVLGWGALATPLVKDGELYRLLSANFLHHYMFHLHLLINGIALYSLGNVVERFLGWERFLLVYLLSGLGTTIASVLFVETSISAGASGCIFGVFGGLAVINLRYWTRLPLGFRQPKRWWVFIIAINAALPLFLPIINIAGHLGGLVVGGLVTYLLLERGEEVRPAPPASSLVRVAALGVAAMFAVGVGTALWRARSYDQTQKYANAVRLGHSVLDLDEPRGDEQNGYAWIIATFPDASGEALRLAEDLASRAAAGAGPIDSGILGWALGSSNAADIAVWQQRMAYNDTLATVYYRQGRFDAAARLELAQVAAKPPAILLTDETWSQLARFLAARLLAVGPLADGIEVDAISLNIAPRVDNAPTLVLRIPPTMTGEQTIYALGYRGQKRIGLLRVLVGAGTHEIFEHATGTDLVLNDTIHFEIAAVADGIAEGTREEVSAGEARWSWHPRDPAVAAYP